MDNVSLFDYRDPPAANAKGVRIGSLSLYFSYQTIVAFHDAEEYGSVVSENVWSNTTGRHLGLIRAELGVLRSADYPRKQFEKILTEVLVRYGLEEEEALEEYKD